jgi:hypothetical protein
MLPASGSIVPRLEDLKRSIGRRAAQQQPERQQQPGMHQQQQQHAQQQQQHAQQQQQQHNRLQQVESADGRAPSHTSPDSPVLGGSEPLADDTPDDDGLHAAMSFSPALELEKLARLYDLKHISSEQHAALTVHIVARSQAAMVISVAAAASAAKANPLQQLVRPPPTAATAQTASGTVIRKRHQAVTGIPRGQLVSGPRPKLLRRVFGSLSFAEVEEYLDVGVENVRPHVLGQIEEPMVFVESVFSDPILQKKRKRPNNGDKWVVKGGKHGSTSQSGGALTRHYGKLVAALDQQHHTVHVYTSTKTNLRLFHLLPDKFVKAEPGSKAVELL